MSAPSNTAATATAGAQTPPTPPPTPPPPPASSFPTAEYVHAQRLRARLAQLEAAGPQSRGGPGSIGVAMEGGGNHSMVSAFALMRGLAAQQLANGKSPVEAIDYISSVSGGGWFNFPYTFAGFKPDAATAEGQHTAPAVLLDIRCEDDTPSARPYPADITASDVTALSAGNIGYTLTLNPTWCDALGGAFEWILTGGLVPKHRLWTRYIHATYFRPIKVPKGKLMAETEAAARAIVAADPRLHLQDFIWPRAGPISIGVFTMMAPADEYQTFKVQTMLGGQYLWDNNLHGAPNFITPTGGSLLAPVVEARDIGGGGYSIAPFTASSAEAGTHYERFSIGPEGYSMGGGANGLCACARTKPLVFPMQPAPPHTFTSRAACCNFYRVTSARLSPEVVAAASSSAYEMSDGACSTWLPCAGWQLARCLEAAAVTLNSRVDQSVPVPAAQDWRELVYSDGATLDNTGIAALLQQRVEHIIYPCNPSQPYSEYRKAFRAEEGADDDPFDRWLQSGLCGDSLLALFGYLAAAPNTVSTASRMLSVVFADGRARLRELMVTMEALFSAGLPMICTLNLSVLANPFWGLAEGTCKLTVIFWAMLPGFGQQVDAAPDNGVEYDAGTGQHKAPYEHVPGLLMVAENTSAHCCKVDQFKVSTLNVDGYTNGQINLTGYLGTWSVDQAWKGLVVDGVALFDGFEDIFASKAVA